MLIWLGSSSTGAGVEDGVIRAHEVQSVLAAKDLWQHAAAEGDACREQARRDAEHTRSAAQALLEAAQQQAETLLAQVEEELNQRRAVAYEEGRNQAIVDWHHQHAHEREQAIQRIQSLDERLADIVTSAVRRIIESEQPQALFGRALENVRRLTREASTMTLRVHESELQQARSAIAALQETQPIEVIADHALDVGSCVFETDLGTLDASLETQLMALRSAMSRAVKLALAEADELNAPPSGEASRLHPEQRG